MHNHSLLHKLILNYCVISTLLLSDTNSMKPKPKTKFVGKFVLKNLNCANIVGPRRKSAGKPNIYKCAIFKYLQIYFL